jgi:hypothetical protein
MDYPENASIIDPKEQQSDYYDRSFHWNFVFLSLLSNSINISTLEIYVVSLNVSKIPSQITFFTEQRLCFS